MKAMLSSMAAEGTVEQLELALKKTASDVNGKSLGNLLNDYFFTGYLVNAGTMSTNPSSTEEAELSAPEAAAVAAGIPYFKYRFQMQMEPDELERKKAALIKFRNLRNELVHHLLDKFNLGETASCQAALAYLDESYEAIDEHFIRLKGWASSMNTALETQIAFMQSNAYLDILVKRCAQLKQPAQQTAGLYLTQPSLGLVLIMQIRRQPSTNAGRGNMF